MLNLKKSISLLLGTLSLAVAATVPAHAQQKTVSVTALIEHPALDAIRDGIHDELKARGFVEGKNLKWRYQSAQGNMVTAGQIARQFIGDHPDVIVAITTSSAQAVLASTKSIPLVYSGVTDPIAAQLVKGWEPSGTNVTGVSNLLEQSKQVDMIKRVLPQAKRIGMVYNPGEANSVVVVKAMREILQKRGMTLVEAPAARTVDVGTAARSLIGKVDVIYTNTDNTVVSAYESLVRVGNEARIPLIASDSDSVKRGAIASLGINNYEIGRQSGVIVARILNGEKPGNIASETGKQLEFVINPTAAAQQGVQLSEDVLKSAKETYK